MAKRAAYTITEFLVSSAVIILLFSSVVGVLIITKAVSYNSIAAYNLQRDVDVLMAKIVRGQEEGGSLVGLRSAKSYHPLPTVTPSKSRINFVGLDDNTRSYYLNNNSVIYVSPTQFPTQRTIYTAPAGANVTLRFQEPSGYVDHETVEVYISISQQLGGRTITGSLLTYVNLMNSAK